VKHRLLYIFCAFLLLLSFVDCAKRGTPSGGKKDSIPPIIVKSIPENFSINFSENEIRIVFDEYIKLKDLQQNLIVSPPLKYTPIITPLNTSKTLKIQILDTLKENTTYSFNFGKSIVDNNEENPYDYFKYVFSTGDYIDSLSLSGSVKDALLLHPETTTAVMLYELTETFNDSLIYSEKPTYVATTRDSTQAFELTNLKEGRYLLLALQEKTNDFIFQPKKDKIGFVKEYVTIPTDSLYTLSIFKEIPAYKIARPNHESKNHIIFGYEGIADDLSLDIISETPSDFDSTIIRDLKKDTLHYWFKPAMEVDSLLFLAKNKEVVDTLTVRIRNLNPDSLKVSAINSGIILPRDTLHLTAKTPFVSFDSEKIQVVDQDTIAIPATGIFDAIYNTASVIFDKTESTTYKVELLPGALTDFFENSHDTLSYVVRTRAISDYGSLNLSLVNAKNFPIIIELVDNNFNVLSKKYITENTPVDFDFVPPGDYYVRIIYDENENEKWDTGDFLLRTQPEKVIYFPEQIQIFSNHSIIETFILK